MRPWLERVRRLLPVLVVVSAFVATVALAGAERARDDVWHADLLRSLARTHGSFRDAAPTHTELQALEQRAATIRRVAHVATLIAAVTACASLWLNRAGARRWPYLSAVYFALSLFAVYSSVRWFGPLWLLPLVVGSLVVVLSAFELVRVRKRGGTTSAVTWGALVTASFAVVASLTVVR